MIGLSEVNELEADRDCWRGRCDALKAVLDKVSAQASTNATLVMGLCERLVTAYQMLTPERRQEYDARYGRVEWVGRARWEEENQRHEQ